MSDNIVEKLRKEAEAWPYLGQQLIEAANEIERLRREESSALGRFWLSGYNQGLIDAADEVVIYGPTSPDLARQKILDRRRFVQPDGTIRSEGDASAGAAT